MCRVQWVNCCHFKLLISCMHFVCFRFCLRCIKVESVRHCLWGKQQPWCNSLLQANPLQSNALLFVSGFVYCASNKSQLGTVCEESSLMMQFTPPAILECHVVLLGIHVRVSNTKISIYLGVNLRTDSYLYWWKANTHIMEIGVDSIGMMLCIHSSFHVALDSTQRLTSNARWR